MAWSKLSRHKRGYGAAWVKTREVILARDMHLCQTCLARGRVTPADAVDHVIPKAKGGTDDHGNLASICTPCHDAKTKGEGISGRGGKVRPTVGPDGWPVG